MIAASYISIITMERISSKSRLATILLVFFLGIFGAHRFYLRKTKSASAMLLLGILGIVSYALSLDILSRPVSSTSVGIFILVGLICLLAVSVWTLVDFITVVSGKMKDERGEPLKKWK